MAAKNSPRKIALDRLKGCIGRGEAIIGGGAGIGLSAKSQEAGGVDLIIIYNSGRYRMAGRGISSFPMILMTATKHIIIKAPSQA
jgi:predicted TIM-barrel enzyme